jgi:hypothetical protein
MKKSEVRQKKADLLAETIKVLNGFKYRNFILDLFVFAAKHMKEDDVMKLYDSFTSC